MTLTQGLIDGYYLPRESGDGIVEDLNHDERLRYLFVCAGPTVEVWRELQPCEFNHRTARLADDVAQQESWLEQVFPARRCCPHPQSHLAHAPYILSRVATL